MARTGVTREQVFQAADTMLMQGQRPSVERIRVVLGTGSPNTVSPMLDAWFKALGPRLVGIAPAPGEAPDGVPLEVRNAVRQLWDTALKAATHRCEQEAQAERDQLADALAKVRDKDAALEAARAALEENARLANEQADDLRRQVATLASQLQQADARADQAEHQLRENRERAQAEIAGLRTRLDEQAREHAAERAANAERAAANERRHLQEIDRARTEAARVLQQLQDSQGTVRTLTDRLEQARGRIDQQAAQIAEQEREIARQREQLSAAAQTQEAAGKLATAQEARLAELTEALRSDRDTAADLRARLARTEEQLAKSQEQVAAAAAKAAKPRTAKGMRSGSAP